MIIFQLRSAIFQALQLIDLLKNITYYISIILFIIALNVDRRQKLVPSCYHFPHSSYELHKPPFLLINKMEKKTQREVFPVTEILTTITKC